MKITVIGRLGRAATGISRDSFLPIRSRGGGGRGGRRERAGRTRRAEISTTPIMSTTENPDEPDRSDGGGGGSGWVPVDVLSLAASHDVAHLPSLVSRVRTSPALRFRRNTDGQRSGKSSEGTGDGEAAERSVRGPEETTLLR